MSDDGYSASELRKRNLAGGTLKDSELSAAQLRSRYAIPQNKFEHQSSGFSVNMMVGLAGAAILVIVLFFALK